MMNWLGSKSTYPHIILLQQPNFFFTISTPNPKIITMQPFTLTIKEKTHSKPHDNFVSTEEGKKKLRKKRLISYLFNEHPPRSQFHTSFHDNQDNLTKREREPQGWLWREEKKILEAWEVSRSLIRTLKNLMLKFGWGHMICTWDINSHNLLSKNYSDLFSPIILFTEVLEFQKFQNIPI